MSNEILCTIDFTESSLEALKWSIRQAKESACRLTILYTYRLFKSDGEAVAMKRSIEEEANRKFAAIEKELLMNSGISYGFKTEIGFVKDRVEQHARKSRLSFLVMGRQMSADNQDSFDNLVSQLQIPLVIVP